MIAATPSIETEAQASQVITTLPILVLFPHNRCNCRCLMCDIWKIRKVRELAVEDLKPHLASLRSLRVRWVVFSGGEALMHSDLAPLSRLLHAEGIRLTLLTAGLLLERRAELVASDFDDIIVSLDGPREVHDRIRGVPRAYARLARGIEALRKLRPDMPAVGRCTVQKANFSRLREVVQSAKDLGLNSISFLAADVTSEAFNRPQVWPPEKQAEVAPDQDQIERLGEEIEAMIRECDHEIRSRFVVEDPDKLRRIVQHFRAALGQTQPVAPRCNAPWVSAVVEADGTVRPCFFHKPIGNLRSGTLLEVLNSPQAVGFRAQLDVRTNPTCRRCVCSLYHRQSTTVTRATSRPRD